MILLLTVVVLATFVGVAYAASQPIEWADNPNSYRYYLSYAGRGYGACDWNDYGFRINKSFSADPEKYRLHSFNGQVANVFRNKSVIGHNLETPNDAYLCTGLWDTLNAGGAGNVASNLFVWVQ